MPVKRSEMNEDRVISYNILLILVFSVFSAGCDDASEKADKPTVMYNDIVVFKRLLALDNYNPITALWRTGDAAPERQTEGFLTVPGPTDWWLFAELQLTPQEYKLAKQHSPKLENSWRLAMPSGFSTELSNKSGDVIFTHKPDHFTKGPLLHGSVAFNDKEHKLFLYLFTM